MVHARAKELTGGPTKTVWRQAPASFHGPRPARQYDLLQLVFEDGGAWLPDWLDHRWSASVACSRREGGVHAVRFCSATGGVRRVPAPAPYQAHFAGNIERMTRAIDRYFPSGTRVSRPVGGFVLWLEFPTAVKARALLSVALDQGVCFAPGDVFSASGRFSNCLRISCGHSWDARIERGVARLGTLAAEALAKKGK